MRTKLATVSLNKRPVIAPHQRTSKHTFNRSYLKKRKKKKKKPKMSNLACRRDQRACASCVQVLAEFLYLLVGRGFVEPFQASRRCVGVDGPLPL